MRRFCSSLIALWLLAAVWAAAARAAEPVAIPPLSARVTDLTTTLTAEQRQALESTLAAIEAQKGAQIAILLLPTTQPETIEQFGVRLMEAWKIGRKGVDDGVIVIVAKDDRRMRIEVGYGLEGAIPDAVAKRIIAERMAPRFKAGDFAGGLAAAVAALDEAIGGGPTALPQAAPAGEPPQESMVVVDDGIDMTPILMFSGVLLAALIALIVIAANRKAIVAGSSSSGSAFASDGWSSSSSSSSDSGFSGGGGESGGGGASGSW